MDKRRPVRAPRHELGLIPLPRLVAMLATHRFLDVGVRVVDDRQIRTAAGDALLHANRRHAAASGRLPTVPSRIGRVERDAEEPWAIA